MLSACFFVVIFSLRIIIGRKVFPCSLYTLSFFVAGPLTSLPTTCRCLKLYFMYKLNLQKTKLFGEQKLSLTDDGGTLVQGTDIALVEESAAANQQLPQQQHVASTSSLNSSNNSSSTTSMLKPNESQAQLSTTTPSSTTQQQQLTPLIPMTELRKFKFYQFMVSHTFVLSAYFLCFTSQILFWIILGGIDEIAYSSSSSASTTTPNTTINQTNSNTTATTSTAKRFFVVPGFFQFSYGCIGSAAMFGVIIAEALVYYIVEWTVLVLCIRSDRDTWNIKKETVVHVIVQPFVVAAFIVMGVIPVIAELVDYFVPYLLILLFGSVFELTVCVVLPVCYDIRLDHFKKKSIFQMFSLNSSGKAQSFSSTEILLKDPKAYSIFLDFARRSYTPEPVLCWTDIQKYKKLNKMNRKEKALQMVDNYVTVSAPLELNLPNINDKRRVLLEVVESSGESPPPIEMFNELETHCLQDLLDLQQRLVDQNDFIASLVG